MRGRSFGLSIGALMVTAALLADPSPASAPDFYKGKTITLLVGFPPGGGFDANARLLGRHLGRHIPGDPTVIVANAPGASSMTAVVRLDVNQPTDGTVIDEFNFGLLGNSLLQPSKVKLDFRRYAWIGSISEDVTSCYLWGDYAPKTIAEMKTKGPFRFGSAGAGASDDINTKILRSVFGVDVQQIAGYAGSAEIRIAIERGELVGDCGTWSSLPDDWKRNPKLHPIFRTAKSVPDGMSPEVPYVLDIAPTDNDRKVVQFLEADGSLGRPFIVSHAVPADRLRILRQAFSETVRDEEFLADANNLGLPVAPTSGEDAAEVVGRLYETPADIVAAARKIVLDPESK